MENSKTKIERLLKTPGVFNWARQNRPRYDDTLLEVRKLVDYPPQRSLQPINLLIKKVANRKMTFEEAVDASAEYKGYFRMAADEILPALDDYLTQRQIEVADEYFDDRTRYPFARNSDGTVRSMPIGPTFVGIENDRLIPSYVLAWAAPKFSLHQARLICTIIADGILTLEDFIGSDGRVIFLKRNKWGGPRIVETWRVSDYATMTREELEEQFDRYNRAVAAIITDLTVAD